MENAQLIAAAQKLLRACRRAADLLKETGAIPSARAELAAVIEQARQSNKSHMDISDLKIIENRLFVMDDTHILSPPS